MTLENFRPASQRRFHRKIVKQLDWENYADKLGLKTAPIAEIRWQLSVGQKDRYRKILKKT